MANIKQLKEERAATSERIAELNREIGERAATPEQSAKWDQLEAEWRSKNEAVQRAETAQEIEAAQAAQAAEQNPQANDAEARYSEAFNALIRGGMVSLNDQQRSLIQTRASKGVDGAVLIPTTMYSAIEVALKAYGGLFSVADIITTEHGGPMTFPTINDTDNKASIVTEYGEVGSNNPTFGSKTINVHTYRTPIIPISFELLNDTGYSLDALLPQLIAEAIGRGVNDHLTMGNGTDQPQGIITAATKGADALSAAISFDDLLNLMSSVDAAYAKNAKFMMNTQTMFALMRLKDKNDRFVFTDAVSKGMEPMLFGKPVAINEEMQGIGAGNTSVAFGDFKKYKLRQVKGVSVLRLNEMLAKQLAVGIFGYGRYGGALLDAGTNPVKKLVHVTV